MLPSSAGDAPKEIPPGETLEFTVQLLPLGEEVTGFNLSMTFAAQFLEVLDSDPDRMGVQIASHPDNPLSLVLTNRVDNDKGRITFAAGSLPGSAELISGAVNLAVITFMAKDVPTTPGSPTEVVFLVDNGRETAISKSGKQLLENTSNFTGAWIKIIPSS